MAPSQGSREMSLLRAELPAGEAAGDLAVFAAAASAVGWPAVNSNSSAGSNQFIGFIVIFKVKFKTDVSFFTTRALVKYPTALFGYYPSKFAQPAQIARAPSNRPFASGYLPCSVVAEPRW